MPERSTRPAQRTKSSPRAARARRSINPLKADATVAAPTVWDRFAGQLQQCVNDMGTDDILILSRKRANQYVQLRHWGFGIVAEASSNAYILPPTALLDERQYARAKALGWSPPTVTPEIIEELERVGEGYEGSPNFHRMFELGEAGIVDLLVKTLRQVFKVECPSELLYKSFTSDGSSQIRWPNLTIKRELL
jgi:hypothetical protein